MIMQPAPRWASLLPGLAVLRGYERSWLRGDLLAGITVAAYMIPQVMAYAEVAGLPAVVGLWAMVGPLLVYAIFGSSRQLSVGPESTTALMTAMAVGALAGRSAPDPQRQAQLAAVLAIATGLICLAGYLARLGFLAGLLSRPVLVGYMAGVAILMMISQLGKLTGLTITGEKAWQQLTSFFSQLGQTHLPTAALGLGVLVTLIAVHRWWPSLPGPLIVMLIAAGVVHWTGLAEAGVEVVGTIQAGLPRLAVPEFTGIDWGALLPAAAGIAIVGYSDNALTGRAFAARQGERIDANQELLALGLANVVVGCTQGFPVSSSGSRTTLGESMGSRTQLYSLVALAMLVGSMFFLGPVLATFPRAALGGVVVYAALRLIDIAELRRLARFRLAELLLALATTVSVIAFDVLGGIGIAVAASLLDLLRRIAYPQAAVLGFVPGVAGMHNINDYPDAEQLPGLVVFRYDSPLFFANAENFRRRVLAAAEQAPKPVHWFVLNCEANTSLDLTAIDALDEVLDELNAQGIIVAMARVKQDTRDEFERAGLLDKLGERIYPTLPTAVEAYYEWIRQHPGATTANG